LAGNPTEGRFGLTNRHRCGQELRHIRSGKLQPIAVTSRRRAAQLPDVPTLDEVGVSGFDAQTPFVLMAPAGTPEPVIRKLNDAVNDVLADPAVKTRLAELGNEIQAMTPGELAAFLGKEDQTVAELAKTGLLKPEQLASILAPKEYSCRNRSSTATATAPWPTSSSTTPPS
jgi:tripartite-type tricarboxylate transporter receptor subunit TctC